MRENDLETTYDSRGVVDIARNLRHYAQAGAHPTFAAKLLAAARELEALATPSGASAEAGD